MPRNADTDDGRNDGRYYWSNHGVCLDRLDHDGIYNYDGIHNGVHNRDGATRRGEPVLSQPLRCPWPVQSRARGSKWCRDLHLHPGLEWSNMHR